MLFTVGKRDFNYYTVTAAYLGLSLFSQDGPVVEVVAYLAICSPYTGRFVTGVLPARSACVNYGIHFGSSSDHCYIGRPFTHLPTLPWCDVGLFYLPDVNYFLGRRLCDRWHGASKDRTTYMPFLAPSILPPLRQLYEILLRLSAGEKRLAR